MAKKKNFTNFLHPRLRDKLRTSIYHAETIVRRPRFSEIKTPENGWPILLGISFPKSGTQLLNETLLGFSEFTPFAHHIPVSFSSYDGNTGLKRSEKDALNYLDSLRPLDVTAARLWAWSAVVERINSPAFVPFFIFRDLRDVAISHVFYIAEMLPEDHQQSYAKKMRSFDERLTLSILGLPDAKETFPDIAERFSPYLEWLNRPEVLKLHVEDFIHDRRTTLGRVFDHVLHRVPNLPIPREEAIDILAEKNTPENIEILRPSKIGEWKKYFTEEHKRIFKEIAGDLLIRLGYEEDRNW